ncbi:hypothetical protein A3762_08305 [Oleiphilus sp. HI0125]|uniref:glycosyltransferase n=1 Tax=Oleiphilus sp. HI0125 TaxID=1822266 RepID=UPI0007C3E355|nr:glycosyltransferase [Oleiphilus sp. HI0125]KZZ58218.1 hypothetical protein A3762_08305 [Oleiphilus sp. HI0125]
MSLVPSAVWITWEHQVRNRSLSKLLGVPLHEIVINGRNPIARYWLSAVKTLAIIRSEKPKAVFHQNPSIFLGAFLILLRVFYRFKLITDTHNAGILPAEGRYALLNAIGKFVTKRTDVAIVHNQLIANNVKEWGVKPFILPDPLPDMSLQSATEGEHLKVKDNEVVFVCRWSADEPYEAVFEAAQLLVEQNSDVHITITGRPPEHIKHKQLPSNITLSGFLSDDEYRRTLKQTAVLLVLTNRTNSLNCGAYEALALGKPCILFDTELLRKFFGESFVFSKLNGNCLARVILGSLDELSKRRVLMVSAREQYELEYGARVINLESKIKSLISLA